MASLVTASASDSDSSDSDSSDSSDDKSVVLIESTEEFDKLIDDMHTMFQTTNAFGVRLDNLDAINIEGRLDAIETSLQAINDVILVPNQNIGDNNGPGAGGGKRRKRTRGKKRTRKRRKKKTKRRRRKKTRKKRGGMDAPPTPPRPPKDNDIDTNRYPPGFTLPPPQVPVRIAQPPQVRMRRRGRERFRDRNPGARAPTQRMIDEHNERLRRSRNSTIRNMAGDLVERCTGSRCGLGGGRRKKKTRKKKKTKRRR